TRKRVTPPPSPTGEGAGSPVARWLGTAAYGKHAGGVSDRTVRNWCAQGMPHRTEPYESPSGQQCERKLINPEEADPWRARHVGLSTTGGNREGAGRPKKKSRKPKETPHPVAAQPPTGGATSRGEGAKTGGEAETDKYARLLKLDAPELKRRLFIEKIRETDIKNQLAEGKLVARADVTIAITERVIRCRNTMAKLPESVARVAADKLKLTVRQRDALQDLLEQEIDQAVLALGAPQKTETDDEQDQE
ncbi:MAG: hypothetical protein KDA30_14900, partial [Phycisphaerales bacterium]|nr:hypothetical protein [Phycisphaerales bacterium]